MSDSRPFRDNPLLILVGIALLLATFVALIWLPNYSAQLSPDFLSYSVLWGLSVIVLMMLVALAFVLARCFIFGATWLGIYTAKRITRPVQILADGAREIGAGHFDYRIEQESVDEFGSLVAAFNTMAGELSTNRRQLKRSRVDLERKHQEVDGRRRYIETILERIATGVVSIDSTGRVSTINAAATRLLDLTPSVIGQVARGVFERPDLQPLGALLRGVVPGSTERQAQEVASVRDGRERYLAVAVTALPPDAGSPVGTVMVFDDVTPLIRAQRVATWRDVARRLAHEIKNPLTPIQLCAERLRRHFAGAPPRAKALVDECTGTIVGEVESLKALVDEFSHFARMPSPRTVSVDLNPLLHDTLLLYDGLFDQIRIERVLAQRLPPAKIDPEQIRRVVINLVDNAVDVLDGAARGVRGNGPGVISLETQHDASRGVVRLRGRQRPRDRARGSRQAVPAVFLDQTAGERPRARHRSADRRRTRRQYRGERQLAEGNEVRGGAAGVGGLTPES